LFAALAGFDLPYNQAPSLHIVLLAILWDFYRRQVEGMVRWAVHAWCLLIGMSVLTTYQHHAIDVPTGLAAGALCMWLWPLEGPTPWQHPQQDKGRWGLALAYGAGAVAAGGLAGWLGSHWSRVAWVLWWPGLALALVALAYARWGCGVFQKTSLGQHTVAAGWLLAPYRALAWLNARCWTAGQPGSVEVCDGVWLGRLPLPWEPDHARFRRILDVTAELSCGHQGLHCVPVLDLAVPHPARLREAASHLMQWSARPEDPVLVCCALGYSRSVAVVLSWLCMSGRVQSLDVAVGLVRSRRPQVVLSPALLSAVDQAVRDGGQAS
jgi:protein-tyrosine phosphatase